MMAATAKPARAKAKARRWSGEVTRKSDALDLEAGVFGKRTPRAVALSLKRSAEGSTRRRGTPFQSAMAMLNFLPSKSRRSSKNMKAKRRSAS